MNKSRFKWILALMSCSLAGIIIMQVFWIKQAVKLKEEQFDRSVNEAMNTVVDRIGKQNTASLLSHGFKTVGYPGSSVNDINGAKSSERNIIHNQDIRKVVNGKDTITREVNELSIINGPLGSEHAKRNSSLQPSLLIDGNCRRDSFNWNPPLPPSLQLYLDSAIMKGNVNTLVRVEKVNEQVSEMVIEYLGENDPVGIRLNLPALDFFLDQELENRDIRLAYTYGIFKKEGSSFVPLHEEKSSPELLATTYQANLFPNDILPKADYLLLHFPDKPAYILSSSLVMLAGSSVFTLIILLTFSLSLFTLIRQKKIADVRTDFINNMTHELKTPITTISLATAAINDERVRGDSERLSYYNGVIREENERLNRQVEQVLQLALLDSEEPAPDNKKLDLHEVIKKAIENVRLQLQSKGGVMKTSLEAKDAVIEGDEGHLCNVIINLLDNAMKYSRGFPEIKIDTIEKDGMVLMTITDNGIGMSRETRKKAFDKFYRAPTGDVHNVKGFGLGLSYVKTVVSAMGGSIRVNSSPGAGSCFGLEFPLASEKA